MRWWYRWFTDITQLDVNNTSNHTLHLVLPPTQQSTNASGLSPVIAAFPPADQAPPAPPLAHQTHHGPQFPHQALHQAHTAQMSLQNQLNLLQQQLSMNNPIHISAEQVAQVQAQQYQRLAHQMAMHQQQQFQTQQPHHYFAQHEPTRPHTGAQDTRNSDQSIDLNSAQPNQTSRGHPPASQLPMGPTTTTVHEGTGPQGSRMRVVVNETVNYHVSRQGTPVPAGPGLAQPPSANVPFSPPNAVSNFQFFGPPGGPLPPPGFPLPHPNPFMASVRLPSSSAHGQHGTSLVSQAASANATAWLLSTPLGPQALLFAPGHGYFSSAPTSTTAQPITSNPSSSQQSTRHQRQSSNDHARHNPGLPNPPVLAAENGANPAQAQAIARPGEHQRQANNNDDFFHLVLQRGWLFVRLYIFMFVLSEPGTWRRWLLLTVAVIVCLLPRENPLRDLANRVRTHIDGLIPIAAAPDHRQQGQGPRNEGQAAVNEGQPRPARGPAAQQPSPQHAAARIIRQNEERRNHGILRDTIFRVERAMALFLASLVPGVGERHVRAREEARQEAERIENERLARENARTAEENAKKEKKGATDSTEQHQKMEGEARTSSSTEGVVGSP